MNVKDQSEYYCKVFNDIDLGSKSINNSKFENCIFENSNLSNTEFSRCDFINCIFTNCNLENLLFFDTTLAGIRFY